MNAVPAAVGAPRTPLVDLLPPEIEMRRKENRAKRLIVFVVVVIFALIAGTWYLAYSVRTAAESDLAIEQDLTAAKQEELATYDYLPVVQAALDNAVNARATAGSADITWATQLNSLLIATSPNVALTTLAVSAATPSEPLLLDGTPFQQPDLGQLFFSGEAVSEAEVAALQDAIDGLPAFQNTYITSITVGPPVEGGVPFWTFTGSTRISLNALSGRTVTEQEFVTRSPSPSPSPSPSAESEG
ncbi:MAG: hypothetical protein CVT68_05720 [Actinobacteria bacterium HGW-Actinobacteria-8]|nr:MAG: hypothetical protein CVT68_05720 [Actinobacteria bacterium HGW-Actinobacteria-8]